ncbi:MAG TPA: hypothetical protein VHB77_12880, partial [Planctomycetaceae bacterium]|nr:hypothetical protein [Planctomycetaceae bacterium]
LFSAVWPPWTVVAGIFLVCELILNSRTGRDLGELGAEWAEYALRRVGWRLFVSLFEFVMGAFKRILNALERLLYAVDEWLRFRSGESDLMLAAKAVLGLVWAMFAYVIRFAVTLLIEPQINPIKHFPVVTVSHKIILPMAPFGARLLAPTLGKVFANTVAGTTAFLLPGVFGFLVWELKENWRLYAANRRSELQPVVIGEHGETLIRLMKPGFHSGVLPKLYGKLRRAKRKTEEGHEHTRASKYVDKLQHLEEAIRRFVERDLLSLLHESRTWDGLPVEVGEIEIASNSLRIELRAPTLSQYGMWIAFQEQSGWLAASVLNAGWLVKLDGARMAVLSGTLTGFYRKGGVDLVREQIDACFEPRHVPYDITANGLTVWPDGRYELEITYNLDQRPLLTPRPRAVARSLKFQNIDAKALIFSAVSVTWDAWVEFWNVERQTGRIPPLTAEPVRVLPLPHVVPMSDVDPLARLSGT